MDETLSPIEKAVRFGGFVLAHAALIASDLAEGELICPFAIVTKDERRQVIPFEADTQAEALARGKASLDELKSQVDYWGLGREGLWSHPDDGDKKTDVLVASAWTHEMEEPVVLMQRFRPATTGQFTLLGTMEILLGGESVAIEAAHSLRALASDGIAQHPSDVPWSSWLSH